MVGSHRADSGGLAGVRRDLMEDLGDFESLDPRQT
jgi:hypothetical protein